MKKLLGILVFSLFFGGNGYTADYSDFSDKLCTFDEILKENFADCLISENYFMFSIMKDFQKFEKNRGRSMGLKEFKVFIKKKINKQRKLPAYKKIKAREAKAEAEYECSLNSGTAKNSFSAKKIFKTCMKTKGY